MNASKLFSDIFKSLKNHSGTICAAGAAVGVVTTAYFSGRAAVRVDHEVDPDMDKSLKVKTYLKCYWKTVVSGTATIGLIFASDRIHVGNEVALAGVAAMYKDKFKTLDQKATNKFGSEAMHDIHKEMMEEDENIGTIGMDLDSEARSKKLYLYEPITGQSIDTTYEKILEALLECNFRLAREYKAELDIFLEWTGGEATTDSMGVVWDLEDEMQTWNASYCHGYVIDFTKKVNDAIEYWAKSDKEMTPNDRITIQFLIPPEQEGVWDPKCGVKRPRIEEIVDELPWRE